jgi:AraC-like DNA-binding protein
MAGSGIQVFTDPEDYRRCVPGAQIGLVLTGGEEFRVRVTWASLPSLSLACVEERAPRVAFVVPSTTSVLLSFPLGGDPLQYWNGVSLARGEFALHAVGEAFHLRSIGPARWGLISLARRDFSAQGRALLGTPLLPPKTMNLLQLPLEDATRIRRMHNQAVRLAATKPDLMCHREVARSLDQDLLLALISGLGAARASGRAASKKRHAEIMLRFEEAIASHSDRPPRMHELSAAVGVPQRTLRMYCRIFLGRSPADYMRLRRLTLVRSALMRNAHDLPSIAALARQFGFAEPGRFAVAYRALFGESPSATLQRRSQRTAGFA